MNAKLLLIFTLLILTDIFIVAQEKAINLRYKGGERALFAFVSSNLRYPVKSLDNNIIGFSITGISITPKGKIDEILIVNPMDEFIEQDIYRVLNMTKGKWLKCDTISTNQTFYLPIVYTITTFAESPSYINPVSDKFNFIEPVLITAVKLKDKYLPETDEYIANMIVEKLNEKQYSEVLDYINESIRRNPFNKELYQLRMYVNRKLNNNDLVIKDSWKMQNFIPGVSLEEIVNNN
jgi:hypothetical protein